MNSDERRPRFVSMAFDDIDSPDFADVAVRPFPPGLPIDPETWARAIFSVSSAPMWVKWLVGLRQLLVPLIGVRRSGSRVFDVVRVSGEEALISEDDRHLDFRVAVGVDATARLVRVTTAVRLHGWRGRLYFAPVRVIHGPVVQAMVSGAITRLSEDTAADPER